MLEFERDPDFEMRDYYDLSRSQIRERNMRRVSMKNVAWADYYVL